MTFIIATCKSCGMGAQCDVDTLLCQNCSSKEVRKMMKIEMAEVATIAGMLSGWIRFQTPIPDFQAKAMLYSIASIIVEHDLDREKSIQFLNMCIHEFELVNRLHKKGKNNNGNTKPKT